MPHTSRPNYSFLYLASGPEIFLMKPQPTSRLFPRVYTALEATRVQGHLRDTLGGIKLCGVTQPWNSASLSLDGLTWATGSDRQHPEVVRIE